MAIFEKLVGMFAKRKGKQLAKKFKDNPEIQKEVEELDKIWKEFRERGEELSDAIDDYMNDK
jgi:uncharacterized protein YneF (UPF0154 family)